MDLFIIGDIHGCYYTFLKLLQYWHPQSEQLLQVGDLIDRGNFAAPVVAHCRQLQTTYSGSIFLKGNHEAEMAKQLYNGINLTWLTQYALKTMHSYGDTGRDMIEDIRWFNTLPLCWENEQVFVSHAGLSAATIDPYNEDDPASLLWNRLPLLLLPKLQVHGHTPTMGAPSYAAQTNSWNIDTGACYGQALSALQVTANGAYAETISIKTDKRDIN
ncbi:metallophosphoesterase [Deminuibacter soli]|nr:metallophosphoesterase [Deminuibacter soli]